MSKADAMNLHLTEDIKHVCKVIQLLLARPNTDAVCGFISFVVYISPLEKLTSVLITVYGYCQER